MLVFYIKQNINIFQKNTIQDAKNKKENIKIVKNYSLIILEIVIKF